jgi:subfamily B ATP-binding cassette protein MsbA
VRKIIGYVTQDVYLFTGTIDENIRMGRLGAEDAELLSAASAANCDEFVNSFADGYLSQIGERGVKLSGGQRQRIAIARAILKHPRLLLLDEATSSLDNESERLVQDALDRFCKGRTAIVIAHRLSTIMGADKIVFLENGHVLEQGSHEELMQAKGRYYEMFTAAYGTGEGSVAI